MKAADDLQQLGPAEDLLRDVLQPCLDVERNVWQNVLFAGSLLFDDDHGFGAVPRGYEAARDHDQAPTKQQGKDEPPAAAPAYAQVILQGSRRLTLMLINHVLSPQRVLELVDQRDCNSIVVSQEA